MELRAITIPSYETTPSSYDAAPAAYERAGLYTTLAGEGVHVQVTPVPPITPHERTDDAITNIAHLDAHLAAVVAAALQAKESPLVVGSNCNALVGVMAGFAKAFGPAARVGLVWFDAHGDFNTPKTTLTGRIGGMPVAVIAGLAFPQWRAISGLDAPVPTNRIVMVDVRNLDPKERTLIEATDVTIAAAEAGRGGVPLDEAIQRLASDCDLLYLHVDEDILDAPYVPNHGTLEPDGPNMDAVLAALRTVFATGKVAAFGLVSVNAQGEGGDTSLASAMELLTNGIRYWRAAGGE